MSAKVCCLTPIEVNLFISRGELPNCPNCNVMRYNPDGKKAGHSHRSFREVERMVGNDDGSGQAVWIGCRFMCFIQREKVWGWHESGPKHEMCGGPRGASAMQMVNGAAPIRSKPKGTGLLAVGSARDAYAQR